MAGLPGNIFQGSDEEGIGVKELLDRIKSLDEEIGHGLSIPEELECQAVKLSLLKRLSELIREQITSIEKHKSEGTL